MRTRYIQTGGLLALCFMIGCGGAPGPKERGVSLLAPPAERPAATAVVQRSRHALVIGNNEYESQPLKNPVNDARAIGRALKFAGFKVRPLENAPLDDMRTAIAEFVGSLGPDDDIVVYYAGHGMQVGGVNYLIPVGALEHIRKAADVPEQTVPLSLLLNGLGGGQTRSSVVILDACRDNALSRRINPERRGAPVEGLAAVSPPTGTLVAFATAQGSWAEDGSGRHSPYARALLETLLVPGQKIEDFFKEVRRVVRRATENRQTPEEWTRLERDFVLLPLVVQAPAGEPERAGASRAEARPAPVAAAVPSEPEILLPICPVREDCPQVRRVFAQCQSGQRPWQHCVAAYGRAQPDDQALHAAALAWSGRCPDAVAAMGTVRLESLEPRIRAVLLYAAAECRIVGVSEQLAEYFEVRPERLFRRHLDLLHRIEGVDAEEFAYWLLMYPIMRPDQITKLHSILVENWWASREREIEWPGGTRAGSSRPKDQTDLTQYHALPPEVRQTVGVGMRWPPSWPPDLRWPAKHLASIRDFGDAGALKPKARAVATVLAELMGRVREQKLLGPVRRQRMLASSEGSERIVLRVKLTEIANAVSDQDDWPELASRHRRAILVNYVKRLVAPPAPVTKVKLETPWWSGLGTGAFSDIKVVEPDAETRLRARFDSLVQELRASARRHGAPPDELEERVAVVRRKHLRMQVRAWAAQARRRYDAGDLEGALARLDRWAELRGQGVPDLWLDLHVRRAKLLERDEAWSEIIAHLAPLAETVVLPVGEADPDGEWESSHRWLRSTLAGARLNTSREGAQRAFETAGRLVEEAPDHDVYWELLADAGTLLGDMAALERAVAHVSGTTKRWIQTRREGLARGLLTRLTTQPPASYARAQRWVGNVVGEWGETARAELHYRRCLEAVPKVARKERARLEAGCLNSLAFLLAEHAGRDRMGEALDYIDRAWKLAKPVENRLAYMVLTRAEVLVRLGRFDDAEAVREQAVKAGASSGLMAEHRRWCARVLASPPGGEVGD